MMSDIADMMIENAWDDLDRDDSDYLWPTKKYKNYDGCAHDRGIAQQVVEEIALKNNMWPAKNNKLIKITDLDYDHICNILNMMKRTHKWRKPFKKILKARKKELEKIMYS